MATGLKPEIRTVETRRDLKLFLRLPRLIYAGMAGFSPRLDFEQAEILDPKRGPFFRHGRARYFLAVRDGVAVGRISAQIDDLGRPGEGLFGCLDAIDDFAVVEALLTAAEGWLAGEGARLARGPFMLSINGESGLLLEGQMTPAMVMMGWSPAYLADHLERAGYQLGKRLLTYRMALEADTDNAHAASLRGRLVTGRNRVRGLDMANLAREAEIFATLFNDAWAGNWGFAPITQAEIAKMLTSMRLMLHRDFGVVFETDGKPIGFALALPNLAEIVHEFNGRLLPFNWLKLGRWALGRKCRSVRIILMGVAGAVRSSVLGAAVPIVLIDELIQRSKGDGWQVDEIEMGWVLEDNLQVRALIEKVGGNVDKTYGIFDKELAAPTGGR
ncbi:MAG: hypothetical protein R3D02_07155 [Hyphomicrobiales bacterium]